jgi:hypothetical protein
MAVKIRPGDVEADRAAAISLLSRYVNPAYDGARFDWLYRANPAGRGRLWMAVDGSTGDLIGTAGAFPRWLSTGGRDLRGWLLADFCIAEGHRALGPALQLQRACLEDLAADGAAFWYDFPSRTMEAVYRRLGVAPRVQVTRRVRLLRSYDVLRQRLGSPVLARALGLAVDLALAWGTRAPASLPVTRHEGPCGGEFTDLARTAGPGYGAVVRRRAEYLNWRYLDNPIRRHDILAARRDGRLLGYAAVTMDGDSASIVDLFGIPDPRLIEGLTRGTLGWLRRRGAASVTLWLLPPQAWVPGLHRLGFRPRETAPVMLEAAASPAGAPRLDDPALWLLTHGDGDS